MKTLLIINGHPDPRMERFCAGLSAAYQSGAEAGGWQVRRLDVGACSQTTLEDLKHGCGDSAKAMVDDMAWADRLAVVYPLWFGQPPEGLHLLFSYLAQPGASRKAHVIVTMDMPAFAYRSMLRPGGKEMLMLELPGLIAEEPVLIGCVSSLPLEQRQRWLASMRDYGLRTTLGSSTVPLRSASLGSIIDRKVAQWWGAH
ncbi:MAG: NAD(P)H-dependent oxidoreductase [Rhizomicrobium sp.]|nr:NAD(P)H-dependent oxidoreductase [Rhizomicrobium sp.]